MYCRDWMLGPQHYDGIGRCTLLLVAQTSQPTCENHNFAAWQHKCIGLLAVHHDDLPLEPAHMFS